MPNFIVGPDQKLVTKRPWNLSPGLILGSGPFSEPDPLQRVSGPSLAGNRSKNKYKLYLLAIGMSPCDLSVYPRANIRWTIEQHAHERPVLPCSLDVSHRWLV